MPLEPARADQALATADPVRTVETLQVGLARAGLAPKPRLPGAVADALGRRCGSVPGSGPRRATFDGGLVIFDDTTFSGRAVIFDGASFRGGEVTFEDTTFSGATVSFGRSIVPWLHL
ncbi:pentapeptide repeat-containing protein [Streptomyces sp. NPDC058385]|uniref:pentapeptide repeat-containing protein n=1 Tax=Streptomyces sp. NPDC058385 TaxID=3346473 RepID=UPI003655F18E